MRDIKQYQCEGCGTILRELDHGYIGRHRWRPPEFGVWDSEGFVSQSEEDCIVKMAEWRHKQKTYEQQQEENRRRRGINEQRLIDACGADALLQQLLASKNLPLAHQRVHQIASELGINWDELTWDSSQWSEALMRQCLAKAGFTVQETD